MFDTLNSKLKLLDALGVGYLGTVYQNSDPLNLDRIKVDIPDLFDHTLSDTPWCGPSKFSPFGCGDGYGVHGSPAIGSTVLILFHDDDPHYPVYTSLPTSDGDFASGECWGFKDNYGNKFRVDPEMIVFSSHDGVEITISGGNVTLRSDGSITANAGSTMTLQAATTMALKANSITMTAPTITQTASGSITQTSGSIKQTSGSITQETAMVTMTGAATVTGAVISGSVATGALGGAAAGAPLNIPGAVNVGGDLRQGGVSIGKAHTHGGVMSGDSSTLPVAG